MGVRFHGLGKVVPLVLLAASVLGVAGVDACSAAYMPESSDAGVPSTCEPRLCPDDACGTISDGCGRALDCGSCGGASQCVDNRCACLPRTCKSAGATCGQLTDGCTGNVIFCGACEGSVGADASADASRPDAGDAGLPSPLYCGAENRCVPVPCTPKTKDDVCKVVDKSKKPCGSTSDGCGGMVDCGSVNCTGTGQTCGGGGVEGICGCKPKSSLSCLGRCGNQPNGCGGYIYCGSCK